MIEVVTGVEQIVWRESHPSRPGVQDDIDFCVLPKYNMGLSNLKGNFGSITAAE